MNRISIFNSILIVSIIVLLKNEIIIAHDNSNPNFKDEWAVHIEGGIEKAQEYASRHGLQLVHQVRKLNIYRKNNHFIKY